MRAKSRRFPRVVRAPLALATDGTVLLNLTELDVADDADALANAIMEQKNDVFVGIRVSRAELQRLLRDVALVAPSVTLPLVRPRLRRHRS